MPLELGKGRDVEGAFDPLECMRAPEVARKLGVSTRAVVRLLRNGMLPGFKFGKSWLVRKRDLENYLVNLSVAARVEQKKRDAS